MIDFLDILNRFYVVPFGQSELVDFHEDNGNILITWNDSDNFDSFRQEFKNQAIAPMTDGTPGAFMVTTIDGDDASFIALCGVDLFVESFAAEQPT